MNMTKIINVYWSLPPSFLCLLLFLRYIHTFNFSIPHICWFIFIEMKNFFSMYEWRATNDRILIILSRYCVIINECVKKPQTWDEINIFLFSFIQCNNNHISQMMPRSYFAMWYCLVRQIRVYVKNYFSSTI